MKNKKKILLDAERLRYPKTGLGNVCMNMVKGLRDNVKVSFFGPFEKLLPAIKEKDKIESWKSWHKFFAPFIYHYDIVHVWFQTSSYFRWVPQKTVKILTLHDLNCLHEDFLDKKIVDSIIRKINKNLKYTTHLVFISNYVMQDFIRNKNLFETKNILSMQTIYNGVKFPENAFFTLSNKYDHIIVKNYILNIGVLFPKKNQLCLVELLPYIEEDLVIVTSQIDEDYLKIINERATFLKVSEKLHILNDVSDEEKFSLISKCKALLHPSLAEGFGIPPIEAMYFGKPVFLSNLTSLPEIGGECAFYFDSFEAKKMVEIYYAGLEKYRFDKEVYEIKMKNWIQKFTIENMISSYENLYSKILES